jgi:hypothetical protein
MQKKTTLLYEVGMDDLSIIGVYSSYENYRFAFLLNLYLGWQFERLPQDLDIKYKDTFVQFPMYKSKYHNGEVNVFLIANRVTKQEDKRISTGLFDQQVEESRVYKLLPELKHLDYLIKIENEQNIISLDELVKKINQADLDASALIIPNKQIKSKGHLIID